MMCPTVRTKLMKHKAKTRTQQGVETEVNKTAFLGSEHQEVIQSS